MFIDVSKIAVTHGENTIFVKRKMDFGTTALVRDELFRIGLRNGGKPDSVYVSQGAQELALLVHNIVGWEGPGFAGVPCTEENIKRLDPDEPIIAAVVAKINELNTKRAGEPDPKSSMSGGEVSSTAGANPAPEPLTTSTST